MDQLPLAMISGVLSVGEIGCRWATNLIQQAGAMFKIMDIRLGVIMLMIQHTANQPGTIISFTEKPMSSKSILRSIVKTTASLAI